MRNIYLRPKTAADVDLQVTKILRDVGVTEPPVPMDLVLDRLQLDRRYYSTTDDGFLRETIHKLKVAGKQVLLRPSLLLEAVRKLSLKALYLPDRKRIMIDQELPQLKRRWAEAHEVIHSVTPWHEQLMLGDTELTLSPACHQQIEAEANYGAGRLLFLQDRFREHLDSSRISMSDIRGLAKHFGNTITSTLWRAVEHLDFPAIGVISGHPNRPNKDFDPTNPCEYFIRSRAFVERFGDINEARVYSALRRYCSWVTRGPLGSAEVILTDDAGRDHLFEFETFHNSYKALTLGLYKRPRPTVVATRCRVTVATSNARD